MKTRLLLFFAALLVAASARAEDPPNVDLSKLPVSPGKSSDKGAHVSITLTADGQILLDIRSALGKMAIKTEPGKAKTLDEMSNKLAVAARAYKVQMKAAGKPWRDTEGHSKLRVVMRIDRWAYARHAQIIVTLMGDERLRWALFGARFEGQDVSVVYDMALWVKHYKVPFLEKPTRPILQVMRDGSWVVKGKTVRDWARVVKALEGKQPVSVDAPDGAKFEAVLQAIVRLRGSGRLCYLVPHIPDQETRARRKLPKPS